MKKIVLKNSITCSFWYVHVLKNRTQGSLHDISKAMKITPELRSHEAPITALAFCSKGCHALTGSKDTTACLWYLKQQSPPECCSMTGHTGRITFPYGLKGLHCSVVGNTKKNQSIICLCPENQKRYIDNIVSWKNTATSAHHINQKEL